MRNCRTEAATDRWASSTEIREADRSHASGPPSSSEHMDVRTARPDGEVMDKFDRIFHLHAILADRRTAIPLEDLMAKLECSKASITVGLHPTERLA